MTYAAHLEDRILVHTPQHVVKEPPSIEQVLFEEGLALMDGMVVDAAKSGEGRE